jgi:hypothetical protein
MVNGGGSPGAAGGILPPAAHRTVRKPLDLLGATGSFRYRSYRQRFSRRPNQDTAVKFRIARNQALTIWAEVTGVAMAA